MRTAALVLCLLAVVPSLLAVNPHMLALIAADCPLAAQEVLLPGQFLELIPANTRVLTVTLGSSDHWRTWYYGRPEPLYPRPNRVNRDDWGPCLEAIARTSADPAHDPLRHITTLRLLGTERTNDPRVFAAIQTLVRVRAEQGHPLRIEAVDSFIPTLAAVPAWSFTDLSISFFKPKPAIWADFLAVHMSALKVVSVQTMPSEEHVSDMNAVLQTLWAGVKTSTVDSLSCPATVTSPGFRAFPPTLRRLELTTDHGPSQFAHACTANLESLTVHIAPLRENFAALVACMQSSSNLRQLKVTTTSGAALQRNAIRKYEQYLSDLATSPAIAHVTIPMFVSNPNAAPILIPSAFPYVRALTRASTHVTAEDLALFPQLVYLTIEVGSRQLGEPDLGDSLAGIIGHGIIRLDFSFVGTVTQSESLCRLAARADTFAAVEHLTIANSAKSDKEAEKKAMKCFLNANRPSLQTINDIPVHELRQKLQRANNLDPWV